MPFHFNPSQYDFWELYQTIARYYPIGIDAESAPLRESFPGTKVMNALIRDNVHDPAAFARWEDFDAKVTRETGFSGRGSTLGDSPAYSSVLHIGESKHGSLTRIRELQYCVSLLGPFYTLFLTDRNEVRVGEETVRSVNAHIVSPLSEDATLFRQLEILIETAYSGYRFVPYPIYSESITGLAVRPDIQPKETLFHALFSYEVEFSGQVFGDPFYVFDRWTRTDPKNSVWTAQATADQL